MANDQNLIPAQPGEVRNPNGRPKGSVNRKTILNWLLFEADLESLDLITKKPGWFDKVKPKTLYETMTIAMAIQAMSGDTKAFNALNRALGEYQINEENINVVHIYKPEKLDVESFNEAGARLREHTRNVVEGELVDAGIEPVESPAGPAGNSPQSTELSQ